MKIEELKDLIIFAREQGLTYIEYDGFKAHLGDLPFTPKIDTIEEDDVDADTPPMNEAYKQELAKKKLKKELFNL